ncbi:alpha/beta-hydrolase [Xylaria grammica]|nr:alpha/beta-hydrolase [Xylaria grammica]
MDPTTLQQQREGMAAAIAGGLEQLGPCPPHLGEAWIDVPLPGNQTNRTKVVWPKSSGASPLNCPLIIYFHGGGYSVCNPDLLLAPARGFAELFSCVVACPSLNQLPEHPFPAPVRMAWETCAWLSDAGNLNDGVLKDAGASVDLGRGFVVGGLSSGAATATVIAAIPGSVSVEFAGLTPLQSPITGTFAGIPYVVSEAMLPAKYRDIFKSRDETEANGVASAAMRQDLEAHLDVFVYGAELDFFRDDSVVYAKWLSELEGVEVRASVVKGGDHSTCWASPPWPACHSREIKELTLDGMAWLLNLEWDRNRTELPI